MRLVAAWFIAQGARYACGCCAALCIGRLLMPLQRHPPSSMCLQERLLLLDVVCIARASSATIQGHAPHKCSTDGVPQELHSYREGGIGNGDDA